MGEVGARAQLGEGLAEFIQSAHFAGPQGVPSLFERVAGRLGAQHVALYLADYEQVELRPLWVDGHSGGESLDIDSTAGGRAFRNVEALEFEADGRRHVWLPLLNGTDRLGVLELWLPREGSLPLSAWQVLTSLLAEYVVSKAAYGDRIHMTRRRRTMALRAEAQRQLLPPLTAITPDIAICGMLEPSYEVAGDAFDYAIDESITHLSIYDAMGHSLAATLTASVAVAAARNTRREGEPLERIWHEANRAVALEFGGERFATALLADFDTASGHLRLLSAGHPPPLLVRDNRVVEFPAPQPGLPLGLGDELPDIVETQLQPRDRLLLFTDGIVEARSASGEFFGKERLVDIVGRESASGLPMPEVVRRLVHSVVAHQDKRVQDDATLVLVDWLAGDTSPLSRMLPTPPLD
jgi:hypothetical protein